ALGEGGEELVRHLGVLQGGDRLAPGMEAAALAEGDELLDDRPQVLRLGQRRRDLLVLDQGMAERLEHRLAVARGAAEAAAAHPMTHWFLLHPICRGRALLGPGGADPRPYI